MIEQYQKTVQETVIEIKNSEIYSVKKNEIVRRAVRLFYKDKTIIAASKGNVGFSSLIKEADKNIKFGQDYSYPFPDRIVKHDSFVIRNQLFTEQEFIRFGEKLLSGLKKKFPGIIFMNKIRFALVERKLAFSDVTELSIRYPLMDVTLLFKRQDSKNVFDGVFPYLSSKRFDPSDYIGKIEALINAVENPVKLRNYNLPVVFPAFDQTIIADKIKESIVGDNYMRGVSLFNDLLGKEVFNERLSVYDIAFCPEKNLFDLFDDESFVRRKAELPIIEHGILRSLIYDRRTAALYGEKPTGNGMKPAYNQVPQTRANALLLRDGENIDTPNRAIMPLIMGGGSVDDRGNFAIPSQFPLLVEDGKITAMLPQLLLSGNIFDILGKNYIGIDRNYFSDTSLNPFVYTRMNVRRVY